MSPLAKEYLMTTGTRQAYLPGGRRTGAPGKHVVRGKAKYRLLDEKVRFFVAPPVEEINASPVRPDLSSSWLFLCLMHPWSASTICRPQRTAHKRTKARNIWQTPERRHDWRTLLPEGASARRFGEFIASWPILGSLYLLPPLSKITYET
jgi:hypothetical protein